MNSINQMVNDLKRRIDDESNATVVKKKKKQNFSNFNLKISWPVVIIILLILAVSYLSFINYQSELERKQSPVSLSKLPKSETSHADVVIGLVPEDEKISALIERQKASVSSEAMDVKEAGVKEIPEKIEEQEEDIASPAVVEKLAAEVAKKAAEIPDNKIKATIKVTESDADREKPKITEVKKQIVVKETKAQEVPASKKSAKQPEASRNENIAKSEKKTTPIIKQKVEAQEKELIVNNKSTPKPKVTVAENADQKFNKTPVPMSDAELAETIYQHGEELIAQGEIARAKALLVKALEEYPAHKKSRETLVGIYVNEQNWAEAEVILKSGVSANKKNVSWAMWLSQIYIQQDRQAEALSVLNDNAVYAKGNGEYFALLAAIRQNTGQHAEALDAYQKALQTDNSASQWWFGMAVVLEFMSSWNDAQTAYNQALETGQLNDELKVYAEQRLDYVKSQIENTN